MIAEKPENEAARLAALKRYEILDTPAEDIFDDVCRLASQICETPIAVITFIDAERQWFKSIVGADIRETSRDIAFCAHAILQQDMLVVEDATADSRFSDNPMVTSSPNIRFYAGAPLVAGGGLALGTICVLDQKPRRLTPLRKETLRVLRQQIIAQLDLRCALSELQRATIIQSRLEKSVRESEGRLFQFLEAVPVDIFVLDAEGHPYYANDKACELLGKRISPEASPEDLSDIYKVFVAGTKQEYPSDLMPIVQALQGKASSVNNMEIHRGDRVIPVDVSARPIYDRNGRVAFAIAAFNDTSARVWTEKRLQAQYAATRVIAESSSLDEAIPLILQSICESVGWAVGAYWIIEEKLAASRCLTFWNSPDADVQQFKTLTTRLMFERGIDLPGRVWEEGTPVWIPNVVEDHKFSRMPAALANGLRAAFGFPILVNDRVVGVMEFFSKQIQKPDEELLAMLGALGTQMGHFVVRKAAEDKHAEIAKQLSDLQQKLKFQSSGQDN